MAGRRRGARSGRGWDAVPPRGSAGEAASGSGTSQTESGGRDALRRAAERQAERRPAAGRRAVDAWPIPPLAPSERAREICLRLLADRPRTRAELAAALRRREIPDDVAAEVLDRYDEVGIVDDAAFARAWVTSRHHGKGLARRALASELRRRGVDAVTVGEALTEIDGASEEETARTLVERRLRTASAARPGTLVRQLVGMLARKGYPPALAFRVVRDALAADSRTAELAEQIDVDALASAAVEEDGDGPADEADGPGSAAPGPAGMGHWEA